MRRAYAGPPRGSARYRDEVFRVVLVLGSLALTLYCLIDLWQTRDREVETLPRAAWIPIVVALPIAWLILGRPARDDVDRPTLRQP